jgi:hypothetical protein
MQDIFNFLVLQNYLSHAMLVIPNGCLSHAHAEKGKATLYASWRNLPGMKQRLVREEIGNRFKAFQQCTGTQE